MKNDDTLYNYCKRNGGSKSKSSLYVIVRIIALCYN